MKLIILTFMSVIMTACAQAPKEEKQLNVNDQAYEKWCQSSTDVTKGMNVIKIANALKRVAPRYPKKAYKRKVKGCVHVVFDVNESGFVRNVRVLKSAPTGYGFERSTIDAVSAWIYDKEAKKNVYLKMDYSL